MISNIHFGNKLNKYNSLLDTGADVSILNWSVFKTIPQSNVIHICKTKCIPLNSASGHGIKSIGSATVRMYINGVPYVVDFVLTSGFKFDILIGIDFVYQQKAKLDFENNTMIIGKKIICLKN